MTHSEKYSCGYVDEDAIDGGDNGVAYAETEPANTAALSKHNLWFNEGHLFPVAEQDKEAVKAAGQNVSEKKTINKDKKILPGKKGQYFQVLHWLKKALADLNGYQECGLTGKVGTTQTGLAVSTQYYFKINVDGGGVVEYDITTIAGADNTRYTEVIALIDAAITAAGITVALIDGDLRFYSDSVTSDSAIALSAGTTGTDLFATLTDFAAFETAVPNCNGRVPSKTWCEINRMGEIYRGAYGCYITEYSLILSKTDFPKEEFDYNAVNVKTVTDANFATASTFNTSDVARVHSNFAITSRIALDKYESVTFRIIKTYSEKQGGNELHKYPYLLEVDYELEISTLDYDATLYAYPESATIYLFTPSIAISMPNSITQTLSLTNMKMKPESLNINEVPEKGIKLYTYTLEIGGACVPAIAQT